MIKQWFIRGIISLAVLFIASPSWAAHPLITDDTGTQGKGKFQLELNSQYARDKEDIGGISVKATGFETAATLSYGIVDSVDLVMNLPYLWGREKEDGTLVCKENGIGDAELEAKIKFFDKEGFSLSLKPGVSFPTGDDDKGLGTGKLNGQVFLIASEEIGPWAFHANLGYIRNENDADERKDIWHVSIAATCEAFKDLNLVANIGVERDPGTDSSEDPAFLIGGVIYSISENLDIDFGVKYGLTDPETDISVLAGLSFRL